jgi:hypothetical protein
MQELSRSAADVQEKHNSTLRSTRFATTPRSSAYLGGGALKVWVAYKLRSNAQGEAWMTLKTLAADTGLEPTSCSRHRNFLIRCGGLIPVNDAYRTSSGTFGPPRFRVVIPEKSRMAELPCGNSAVRSDSQLPCGKIAAPRR